MAAERQEIIHTPLGTLYLRDDFKTQAALDAVRLHETAMASVGSSGRVLKRSLKTNVTIVETAVGPLCVKEFIRHPILRLIPKRIRHSPAVHSWRASRTLRERGIAAPVAVALLLGSGKRSYLVMRVEAGEMLHEYVRRAFPSLSPERRRAFGRTAAAFLNCIYAAGAYHEDMKASNVIVRETPNDWEFALLDLAAVAFPGRVPAEAVCLNLAQLNASIPLQLTWSDRLRFLRELAQERPELRQRAAMDRIAQITNGRRRVWA